MCVDNAYGGPSAGFDTGEKKKDEVLGGVFVFRLFYDTLLRFSFLFFFFLLRERGLFCVFISVTLVSSFVLLLGC